MAMSAVDAFAQAQKNILNELHSARHLFERLRHVASGDCSCHSTAEEVDWARRELGTSLRDIESDLDDLEDALMAFQRRRNNKSSAAENGGFDEAAMSTLRRFIIDVMEEVLQMREKMLQGHKSHQKNLVYTRNNNAESIVLEESPVQKALLANARLTGHTGAAGDIKKFAQDSESGESAPSAHVYSLDNEEGNPSRQPISIRLKHRRKCARCGFCVKMCILGSVTCLLTVCLVIGVILLLTSY